jgi:hypothetical protein
MTQFARSGFSLIAALAAAIPLFAVSAKPVARSRPAAQEPGRTIYVSPDGDDKATGDITAPFKSIKKAVAIARPGDTISLKSGIYRERVIFRYSGEADRPIRLVGDPADRPVIDPSERGDRPSAQAILLQSREGYTEPIGWITIDGIELRNGHDGIKLYNAHDIVIRNCKIVDSLDQGILGNGYRVTIDRNIISGNGTAKTGREHLLHGIYATGTAFTVTNNLIYGNSAFGIQVAAKDYDEKKMPGPEYGDAKDWIIANNTIALNKLSGGLVLWQKGIENCLIENNIFYRNGGINGIVFYGQKDQRHPIRNNLFYPEARRMKAKDEGSYEEFDNVIDDPLFVDPEGGDFHLRRGSPAIDAGRNERAPKVDFEGKPRPQGRRVDIGAIESPER